MATKEVLSYLCLLFIDVIIRVLFSNDIIILMPSSIILISIAFFFVKGTPFIERSLLSLIPALSFVLSIPFLSEDVIKGVMVLSLLESFILGMFIIQILELFKKE